MCVDDQMELAESITSAAIGEEQVSPEVLKRFQRTLAVWLEEAARQTRNVEFYKGLLDKIADNLGEFEAEAYTQDDGGTVDEPLRIKIPELVKKLRDKLVELQSRN